MIMKPRVGFRFDRTEFAGSLGDLGTLIPLSVALIVITGLSATTVFTMVGLFYILSGLYYRLPIPVQPLKVVAAVAIAFPDRVTVPIMAAAGIVFGVFLLLLAVTGAVDLIARLFTKPIVRGIQLGLGLILARKGLALMTAPGLFVGGAGSDLLPGPFSWNLVSALAGFILVLVLLNNRKAPAALAVVVLGAAVGIAGGALRGVAFSAGPTPVEFYVPGRDAFLTAIVLLVLPQIPLTLGNAVMGTADTCCSLFGTGPETRRATYRGFAATMGIVNAIGGWFGAMPMCHGAGGLAAHYRFGARTGGSNLMIGGVFLLIGILCGKIAVSLLTAIPQGVLGVLLVFAGLELGLLVRDVKEKNDLFVTLLIAVVGLATTNMGIAFVAGMVVSQVIRMARVEI